ncbi:MAG: MYXO-CTERM sorting domain-containing protein [Opitutaceae bacterium]|nr:MYXO-CTERM sorting domain-containing protein [Opitutaceae bacterium]
MKKHIPLLAVAASLATASVSTAQVQLVAGWDFGQFTFEGWSTTAVTQDVDGASIPANYSESRAFSPVSPQDQVDGVTPVNAGTGVIYWNGTNGSSAFDASFNAEIQALRGSRSVNTSLAGTSVLGSSVFGRTISDQFSDPNDFGLGVDLNTVSRDLAIVVDMTGFSDFVPSANGNLPNFSFAASSVTGGSVQWLFNGSVFATSTIPAGDYLAYTVDLPSAFYGGVNTLVARVSVGEFTFDNVQANGLVGAPIPEPSAAAALAGLAGLGLALNRRRRRA